MHTPYASGGRTSKKAPAATARSPVRIPMCTAVTRSARAGVEIAPVGDVTVVAGTCILLLANFGILPDVPIVRSWTVYMHSVNPHAFVCENCQDVLTL